MSREPTCTLTDAELTDPAFVRGYIESHLDSFDCVMREMAQMRVARDADKIDAERWRYARQHSYIEVRCDSPRVDGWAAELLDRAIDQARSALVPRGALVSKSIAAEGMWMGDEPTLTERMTAAGFHRRKSKLDPEDQ